MENKSWFRGLFSKPQETAPMELMVEPLAPPPKKDIIIPAGGRKSVLDTDSTATILSIGKYLKRQEAEFFTVIPMIRKLARVNSDVGQALNDIVQLANTGFKIEFDPSVPPAQVDLMRIEIEEASKKWSTGTAGLHGIANKMFSQLMIGGATSTEWVPNKLLTGIGKLFFINPESIRYLYDERLEDYTIWQKVNYVFPTGKSTELIPLNQRTFRYYALNGDEDTPYGIPPYWAALDPINTQTQMMDNIKFVSKMMGILGYLDVKMEKPSQDSDESDKVYTDRLEKLLDTLKERVKTGFADGVNVGFKDDHEFQFTGSTKDVSGATSLFDLNEQMVSSGLKFDSAFLGRSYGGGGEGFITILFTKMLSQLSNMQIVVSENLAYGIALHLRLKGFKFNYLKIQFNKSTITDELKYQQGQEYKIRNLQNLYADGIISQDQYADAMGYTKPNLDEPRLPIDQRAGASQKDTETRKDQKDTSARKQRDKEKPQGSKKVPTKTRP